MMSNEGKFKRVRAPNISNEEKSIILHYISQEKHIIESKKKLINLPTRINLMLGKK